MTDPVEGNDASYLFPKQHILGSNPLPGSALSPSCLIPDIAFALSDLVLPEHGYRNYPAGTLKVVVKREIAPLFPMAKRAAINSSGDRRATKRRAGADGFMKSSCLSNFIPSVAAFEPGRGEERRGCTLEEEISPSVCLSVGRNSVFSISASHSE